MNKKKLIKNTSDNKSQLDNDRVQKEAAADKAKPRCFICGKYTDKKTSPQCYGHGGGGGGDSGGGSSEKTGNDDASIMAKSSTQSDKVTHVDETSEISDSIALTKQSDLNDLKFNPEVISELLSKKLLTIDNDSENGILKIKLLCDPGLLSAEQKNELKKFVDSILTELNEFKKEKGLTSNCYTIEKDKYGTVLSLRISLPTHALYEAFIKRLSSKNLLPIQNIEQKNNEKVVYPEGSNHFSPSPLSTKPRPENIKKIEDEFEKSNNKKSSIKPKSPLDGLKPKGWE